MSKPGGFPFDLIIVVALVVWMGTISYLVGRTAGRTRQLLESRATSDRNVARIFTILSSDACWPSEEWLLRHRGYVEQVLYGPERTVDNDEEEQ